MFTHKAAEGKALEHMRRTSSPSASTAYEEGSAGPVQGRRANWPLCEIIAGYFARTSSLRAKFEKQSEIEE